MVGNDIVDFHEAKRLSNWQRAGFVNKLFTERERRYINEAIDPFRMVWRLWSIKEASYKLYTQLHPSRFYNPKGFACTLMTDSGTVKFKEFHCHVETKETSNYIISEARLNKQKLSSVVLKLKSTIGKEQGEELKAELLKYVDGAYELKKNAMNIPSLSNGKDYLNVSLTHHGSYGAFVID